MVDRREHVRKVRSACPRGTADLQDVLRAEEIVDPADHETALVLLERIVAMLTKLIRS